MERKVVIHIRFIPKRFIKSKMMFEGLVYETRIQNGIVVEEQRTILCGPGSYVLADRYRFPSLPTDDKALDELEENFRPCHDGVSYIEYEDGTNLVVSVHGCPKPEVTSEPYTT